MIEVKNLTKRYGPVLAVDRISFEVAKGSIVGFLGPNGAGKSTTLKIMTCYLPATSGKVTVGGLDVLTQSLEVRRKIGYMPEAVPLYPEMRAREYLMFRAALRDVPARQRKAAVARVAKQCWLSEPEDMMRRRLGELSRGYKQRVGLADALVHDPELLILDEPTNGLDPNQIRQIRELIRQLGNSHTVFVSTHILPEVEMTCNRVIIIDNGKIRAADTPANLIGSMRAAGRVQVELQAASDVAAAAIHRLEGVKKVTPEDLGNDWTRFAILADSGADVREPIAQLAAQYGWPLRSLFRHDATLEDVFVELTRPD